MSGSMATCRYGDLLIVSEGESTTQIAGTWEQRGRYSAGAVAKRLYPNLQVGGRVRHWAPAWAFVTPELTPSDTPSPIRLHFVILPKTVPPTIQKYELMGAILIQNSTMLGVV